MNIRLIIVTGLAVCAALWAMPGAARGQTPTPTPTPGNLFVSANLGGTYNPDGGSSIFQYPPAGPPQSIFASNLHAPRGLAFDSNGNLFVAINTSPDFFNIQASILEITPGGLMSTFATGFPFNFFLTGLVIDTHNDIFVRGVNQIDSSQSSIFKVDRSNGTVITFFSASVPSPVLGSGLAFDGAGNLYAPAVGNSTAAIYKFPSTDGVLSNVPSTFVSPEAFAVILQNYPGDGPSDLAFDAAGDLFVSTANDSDTPGACVILELPPNYDPSSLGIGVTTVATGLSRPRGLACDSSGNLFVAETGVPAPADILKFTPGGTGGPIVITSQQITCDNLTVQVQPRTIAPGTDWGVAYFDQGAVTCDFGTKVNRGPYNLTFPPPNTPIASNVTTAVTLTFPEGTGAETTTVTLNPNPSPTPSASEFRLGDSPLAFNITANPTPTTAPIIIAFQVPQSFLDQCGCDVSTLRVLHGSALEDVTCPVPNPGPTPDLTTNTVYASVSSLSPFVIAKLRFGAQVQQPINADGTSVFSVRRGVVPVKFTLTQDGAATCALPAATIALTRTSGGTTGAVDESVYSGSADTGSNFRISSCQYLYNLSASALGVGTYRADIKINGTVVGNAIFQLK